MNNLTNKFLKITFITKKKLNNLVEFVLQFTEEVDNLIMQWER
jgi:hypothetical protein